MDRRIKYVLSIIVAIALVIALLWYAGFQNIWQVLIKINPIWFLPMILVYALDWIIRGLRWRIILRSCNQEISTGESTMHTLIGNTANVVIPAKLGDLARVYSIKKLHKIPLSVGLSSVVFDRLLDFMAVLIITAGLFIFLPAVNLPGWIMLVMYGASLLAIVALVLVVLLIRKPELFRKLIVGPLKRFKGSFDKVQKSITSMVNKPGPLSIAVLLSICIWTCEGLITYFLALAMNISMPIWLILFVIVMANLTKTLPLTPGGIGPYEWVFSVLFVAFGYGLADGTSLGFVDHLFKNLFTIICGGIAASWLGIRLSKISTDVKVEKTENEPETKKRP